MNCDDSLYHTAYVLLTNERCNAARLLARGSPSQAAAAAAAAVHVHDTNIEYGTRTTSSDHQHTGKSWGGGHVATIGHLFGEALLKQYYAPLILSGFGRTPIYIYACAYGEGGTARHQNVLIKIRFVEAPK
jgi:hypothetical protein